MGKVECRCFLRKLIPLHGDCKSLLKGNSYFWDLWELLYQPLQFVLGIYRILKEVPKYSDEKWNISLSTLYQALECFGKTQKTKFSYGEFGNTRCKKQSLMANAFYLSIYLSVISIQGWLTSRQLNIIKLILW